MREGDRAILRGLRRAVFLFFRSEAILVAIAMLAFTVAVYRQLAVRERTQFERTTALAADVVRREVSAEIAERVGLVERLAHSWAVRAEVDQRTWESQAAQLVSAYAGYQSLEWVDATLRVRWYAPSFGNARLEKYDYSSSPIDREMFEAARRSHAVRATIIHSLPHGDNGFVVAAPIFRGSRLEGFIAGSFRSGEVIHAIFERAVPPGYSAVMFDGPRRIHSHPPNAAPGRGDIRVDKIIDVYGVPWLLSVWPGRQSLLEWRSSLPRLVLVAGILISILVSVSVRLAATAGAKSRQLERANRRLAGEIAERRQGAEELRQVNNTLKAVIETSPIAIVRSSENVITGWNRAAEDLLGWSEKEVLGMELAAAGGQELEQWRIRARASQPVSGVECTVCRRDGQPVSAELWVAQHAGPGGFAANFICLLADTRPRKQLEERLRASHTLDAVGRLAAGVAHNFNNLLTIITGYSYLALNDTPPGNPMRDEIEQVLKAADRAARLTVQLLAFGRGQAIRPEVIDLNRAVEDLQPVLEGLAEKNCEIRLSLGADIGQVRVDPQQVEQALVTLVVNAREAMPAGGRIGVETANVEVGETTDRDYLNVAPGPYVCLSVSDNGPGMDEETRRHLFEPFFTTKGLGTTGLGLSSVYGIAMQNGGGVAASSELGKGTRIEVYFPRV